MSQVVPVNVKEDDLEDTQEQAAQYVTFYIDDQAFGLSVLKVHDILKIDAQNTIPLAPKEVAGLINLRGRVVTSISMRKYLNLPELEAGVRPMSIVLEHNGDFYNFMVDRVTEVMMIPTRALEPVPSTLEARWQSIASGVYRLNQELLVLLNIDQIFATMETAMASKQEDA